MYKIDRKHLNILGVAIISSSVNQLLRQVRQNILHRRKFMIVTPNPEQIIQAQTDPKFMKILNSAEISVPDAIGLVVANKFLSLSNPKSIFRPLILICQGIAVGLSVFLKRDWLESDLKVIKGRDFFLEVIKLANKKGWRVMMIGNREKSSQKAADKLKANYKKVKLYPFEGPNLNNSGEPVSSEDKILEKKVVESINTIKPELMIIGFGAPKQEKWVYRWRSTLNVIGTMVVGGTFDFIAGTSKLPPKQVEKLGLEWLWRLVTGSQKIPRIINAAFVFPYKVFLQKLNKI